jgi:parvulin-like peptidyl-prolyl isomerase
MLLLSLAAAGGPLVLTACGKSSVAGAQSPNDVVARVNGVAITRASMQRVVKFGMLTGQPLSDKSAVAQLVSAELICQQAEKLHLSVSSKDLDARVKSLADGVGGLHDLEDQLRAYGLTIADLRASLQAVMLGELLQAKLFAGIQATRAQALNYYESRISLFRQNAAVNLGRIVMHTKAQAEDVIARIRNGQDFAAAAAQFSQDLESKQEGGALGWIDVTSLPDAVAEAIAKLKPGQLSAPVEISTFEWHIYKLYGRRPASTTPFAQVADAIMNELTRQQRAAALTKWVQKERKLAKISILL